MRNKITGENVGKSSAFRSARDKAIEYAKNSAKLNELLDKATKKATASQGRLAEIWESLLAAFRLLRAYASGRYRNIPWTSLVSIVAAVVYFVMPLDLIPDFILALGLIDDVALLGWILSSLKTDIDQFIEWEKDAAILGQEQTLEEKNQEIDSGRD